VSASNADFERLVVDGLFRRDFYFRIKGPEIRVPSLRERRDDIPILAAHFRDKFDHPRERPLSHELMLALLCHSWPGNIRELSQVLRTAVDFAGDALRIPLSPKVVALLAGASRLAVASEPAPAHASEVPSSQVLRQPLMPWSRLPQGYSSTPPPIPGPQDKPESSSPPVTSPRPAEKSRKPPLSHAELERLMEQTDRNISAAAVKADVRRPTLYRWLQKAKIKFRE
jgi:transcriptional regulator of acetoin/glycerol metabolism